MSRLPSSSFGDARKADSLFMGNVGRSLDGVILNPRTLLT